MDTPNKLRTLPVNIVRLLERGQTGYYGLSEVCMLKRFYDECTANGQNTAILTEAFQICLPGHIQSQVMVAELNPRWQQAVSTPAGSEQEFSEDEQFAFDSIVKSAQDGQTVVDLLKKSFRAEKSVNFQGVQKLRFTLLQMCDRYDSFPDVIKSVVIVYHKCVSGEIFNEIVSPQVKSVIQSAIKQSLKQILGDRFTERKEAPPDPYYGQHSSVVHSFIPKEKSFDPLFGPIRWRNPWDFDTPDADVGRFAALRQDPEMHPEPEDLRPISFNAPNKATSVPMTMPSFPTDRQPPDIHSVGADHSYDFHDVPSRARPMSVGKYRLPRPMPPPAPIRPSHVMPRGLKTYDSGRSVMASSSDGPSWQPSRFDGAPETAAGYSRNETSPAQRGGGSGQRYTPYPSPAGGRGRLPQRPVGKDPISTSINWILHPELRESVVMPSMYGTLAPLAGIVKNIPPGSWDYLFNGQRKILGVSEVQKLRHCITNSLSAKGAVLHLVEVYATFLSKPNFDSIFSGELKIAITAAARQTSGISPRIIDQFLTASRVIQPILRPRKEKMTFDRGGGGGVGQPSMMTEKDPADYDLDDIPGTQMRAGQVVGTKRTRRWMQSCLYVKEREGKSNERFLERMTELLGGYFVAECLAAPRAQRGMENAKRQRTMDGVMDVNIGGEI